MGIRQDYKLEYYSWKVLRQKHKGNIDPTWSTFDGFLKSALTKPEPKEDHILDRVDDSKPWGADNLRWKKLERPPEGENWDPQTYSRMYRTKFRPHYDRERRYKNKYGITLQQYEDMLKAQDGRCYVCGLPESQAEQGIVRLLAVDHNHETMEVRKLLDNKCNAILGHAKDSHELLAKLIVYLAEHSRNPKEILKQAANIIQQAEEVLK